MVFRWGHRRVVLAISVQFPFTSRRWALPVLAALYRPVSLNQAEKRRHKTAPDLAWQIVSWFTARWPIETPFQEVRAHLGFETPRQHVANSVLRTAPCLLGLFTVVCLIYAEHVKRHRIPIHQTPWYVKTEPTFSDVMATVHRLLWHETLFQQPSYRMVLHKLSPKIRNWMLDQLCRAA